MLLSFSFLLGVSTTTREYNAVISILKTKAPPRVVIFAWLALRKRILTLDNLRRRGRIVVNGCPMCLRDEEPVGHLLLNCKTAQFIWRSVVEWFDYCWSFQSPCQFSSRLGRLLPGLLEEKNYRDLV